MCGLTTVTRPRRPNGHRILSYHLVLREDRRNFEEQIKFLTDNYKVCSVGEVLSAAKNEANNGQYHIAVTFDDGFRVLMSYCLEVLEKFGIKASFYIPTGFVELSGFPEMASRFSLRAHYYNLPLEPMCPEDLKLLVDMGHDVGSHGVSHTSLSTMSQPMVERELRISRSMIAKWTGKEVETFAYPNSQIGDPISLWVQQAGYRLGLTARRGAVRNDVNPYLLPRDHAEGNWPIRQLRYFLFT